jgi:hypothetical protein
MTNQVSIPEREQNTANNLHSDGWTKWKDSDCTVMEFILWLAIVRDAMLHAENETFEIMRNVEANQSYASRRNINIYDVAKQTMEVCRRWLAFYEALIDCD